jgi:ribosomal protein S18 acetylase RimI-like enzyme
MNIDIRPMKDADMGKADAILKAAFRGPLSRRHELGLYRRIQPDGWFLASRRGDPVGMVGAVVYDAFAHVGMMAVHPAAQRQGVGMALMRFLLSRLDRGGVPLVSLDASEAGRPMYEKLGFVAHGETLTFQRRKAAGGRFPAADIPRISRGELLEVAAWDARCFGAGREKVLRILWADAPDRALLLRDAAGRIAGYLFARPAGIGPWVCRRADAAEQLIKAALTLPYAGAVSAIIPAENQAAVDLILRHGFTRTRANRRMSRGAGGGAGLRRKIYAQASLALG